MIDSVFHVEIDSVAYRLAEDAEGDHYVRDGEPLRSPNAQVVQGTENPSFKARQDHLLWVLSDWSGGEGQRKYDPQAPNRWFRLENVDPFSEPGNLFLGPDWVVTDFSDATDLAAELALTKALGGIAGVNTSTDRSADGDGFLWDQAGQENEWSLAENATAGADAPAARGGVAGDELNLWYIENTTDEVYRYTASAWSLLNDQTSATGDSPMVVMGDYLYIYDLVNHKVYEISATVANTATPETALLDLSGQGGAAVNDGVGQIFVSGNRVYVMQVLSDETVLWEIAPTTAAGPGYAVDVARFEGFSGETGWGHLGIVYMVGADNGTTANTRSIMYWIPGQSYGSLGNIRKGRGLTAATNPAVAGQSSTLLTTAFFLGPHDGDTALGASRTGLWVIDATSGGYALVGVPGAAWTGSTASEAKVGSVVEWEGEYFVSLLDSDGTTEDVLRTIPSNYNNDVDGVAISPSWNMGTTDPKMLESITIEYESLPASTTIEVYYSRDGAAYELAGIESTDNTTREVFTISSSLTSKTFTSLQVKVVLTTTSTSNTPVLREVQVRASILPTVRRWRLLLDLSDERSGSAHSGSGYHKITHLAALAGTETVIDFKDGYVSRLPNYYHSTSVRVDSYRMLLTKPGEGVAIVDLIEIEGASTDDVEGVVAE